MSFNTPVLRLVVRLWPTLRTVRGVVVGNAVLVVASLGLSVGLLWLVKGLVDDVFTGGRIDRLPAYLVAYVAVVGIKGGLDHLFTRLDAFVIETITLELRTAAYRNLVSVSPAALRRYAVGDLLSRLSGEVGRAEYLVYSGPLGAFSNLVAIAAFLGSLFALSPALTLCAVGVAPLLALASWKMSRRVRRNARVSRRQSSAWMSLAEERLAATPTIQVFDAAAAEANRFRARLSLSRRAELRSAALQAKLSSGLEAIGCLGGLLVIAVGAAEIHRGALSVGALIAFIGSVGSLYGPVRSLARSWSRFERSSAGAQRLVDLIDLANPVQERPCARSAMRVRGQLELRDVQFAYPNGPPVLNGVSFRAEPGETVAIVGSSGSGKSTIARLTLRFFDPDAGAILIDGQDIRDLTLSSLRASTCVLFQEPTIFRGSVSETIRYGRPGASAEEIAGAARAAHASGFIEGLPGRYSALLGSRGGRLSGGQRQRLALARALLRDAPILFLDEATAAVDSETEELIQDAIARLSGLRTTILVGHRLSSVRRADRILLLEDGRIIETGSPDSLLSAPTRCRELFAAQLF